MKNLSTYKTMNKITTIGNTQTGHHYWVGHVSQEKECFAGQTFKSPQVGALKSISIFPEIIVGEAEVVLSVYEFDTATYEWKEKKAESQLQLNNTMEKQWVCFELTNIVLDNSKQYAFKISCNNGGMMAIAESHWKEKNIYKDGEQWIASSENPKGAFHRNFDLSFIASIENN